jgi:hypothetical protein
LIRSRARVPLRSSRRMRSDSCLEGMRWWSSCTTNTCAPPLFGSTDGGKLTSKLDSGIPGVRGGSGGGTGDRKGSPFAFSCIRQRFVERYNGTDTDGAQGETRRVVGLLVVDDAQRREDQPVLPSSRGERTLTLFYCCQFLFSSSRSSWGSSLSRRSSSSSSNSSSNCATTAGTAAGSAAMDENERATALLKTMRTP